jgi:hypothetical protein
MFRLSNQMTPLPSSALRVKVVYLPETLAAIYWIIGRHITKDNYLMATTIRDSNIFRVPLLGVFGGLQHIAQ